MVKLFPFVGLIYALKDFKSCIGLYKCCKVKKGKGSARCIKQSWKVGNVGRVGKVGREGLIMPTWYQLRLPIHYAILAIFWQDFPSIWLEEN